ncbi:MAG: general secretion pathway protein GspK [Deltaproteobacteria bacterium]|nr:general secretion pathway protein GspK [Deltaproteobacteria bacterium]
MTGSKRESGAALLIVIFFVVLLSISVSSFLGRAMLDASIITNQDNAASAATLARGGIRVALHLMMDSMSKPKQGELAASEENQRLLLLNKKAIWQDGDDSLHIGISMPSNRLNLNSMVNARGDAQDVAHEFLTAFIEKIVDEMEGRPEDKSYDAEKLAWNLIDYIDEDDEPGHWASRSEDTFYQKQTPKESPANRPLLSVEELHLIEGFDPRLVDAMRPYVTVFPYVGTDGINPNTAPPHVLSTIYHQPYGPASDYELLDVDIIEKIIKYREEEGLFCLEPSEECLGISEYVSGQVFPPLSLDSTIYILTAVGEVGGIRRSIEVITMMDRSTGSQFLLSWKER